MVSIIHVTSRCIHGKAKARSTLRHLPNCSGISGQVLPSCHPSATLLIIAPSHLPPEAGSCPGISAGFAHDCPGSVSLLSPLAVTWSSSSPAPFTSCPAASSDASISSSLDSSAERLASRAAAVCSPLLGTGG